MSTSDRELLELAARAAGYEVEIAFGRGVWINDGSKVWPKWNPLTDDGDALRLAVKLRLVIDTDYNGGCSAGSADISCDDCVEYGENMLATRRAIVRAAAEIGRSMK